MESSSESKISECSHPRTLTRLQSLLSTLPAIVLPARPPPLKEFTLFPKLPAELRNKVWKHSTQISRRVKVFELNSISTENGWDSSVQGQPRIPGIMQASRESRHEGAKVYKLCYEKPQPFQVVEAMVDAHDQEEEEDLEAMETDDLVQHLTEVIAAATATARVNALYINFETDILVLMAPNRVWDTYEAASIEEAMSITNLRGLHRRPTILLKGGDGYTISNNYLKYAQRVEQIYHTEVGWDVGFLVTWPVYEVTLAFQYHTVPGGDSVEGDLRRCKYHCRVKERFTQRVARNKIITRVPVHDIVFQSRFLREFGQDLDPSPGNVQLPPYIHATGLSLCSEETD